MCRPSLSRFALNSEKDLLHRLLDDCCCCLGLTRSLCEHAVVTGVLRCGRCFDAASTRRHGCVAAAAVSLLLSIIWNIRFS